MADTTKISNLAASTMGSAMAALLNGGTFRIYDGSQPATVDTAVSTQTLLADPTFSATAGSTYTNGTVTFAAITTDGTANATGTATWFRAIGSTGSAIWDGSVGTAGATLNMNSTVISAGAAVSITSLTFVVNKG